MIAKKYILKLAIVTAAALFLIGGRVYTVSAVNDPLPDSGKAKAAFKEAAKVFFSPRCANCHAAGDGPTQGDAMKPHDPEMVRGKEGRGTEDLQCNACHMDTNTEGDVPIPGVPDWHMPPADHKMPIQGLTVGELCRQIKDPLKNGGRKTPKDSIKHMESDAIVLWAWAPGNNRSIPPLSHADFMKKLNEWASNGAACPD